MVYFSLKFQCVNSHHACEMDDVDPILRSSWSLEYTIRKWRDGSNVFWLSFSDLFIVGPLSL